MHEGFRYVGALPSIAAQRELEAAALASALRILDRKALALLCGGVGDGYGLDNLLDPSRYDQSLRLVACVDLVDFLTAGLARLPHLQRLGGAVQLTKAPIQNVARLFEAKMFDVAIYSGVLHEVPYDEKLEAFAAIASVLRENGFLLYSDMFLDNRRSESRVQEEQRQARIQRLYGLFLDEAETALRHGNLNPSSHHALVGDENSPGLLYSRARALLGLDDYYEPLDDAIARLRTLGFVKIDVQCNPQNPFFHLIVAWRG
jgi:SAM-dependent methyltransferase